MDLRRIKKYRKERGYSLAVLSEKTGYTCSFLSQIERGLKQPSLEALRKIVASLDIPIFSLFLDADKEGNAPDSGGGKYALIRKRDRRKDLMPEIMTEYEFITPYPPESDGTSGVIGMCATIRPGRWSCEKDISLTYDISLFIVKGKAEARVGGESFELFEGDSVYIYADVPHNVLNSGTDDLIIVGYTARQS